MPTSHSPPPKGQKRISQFMNRKMPAESNPTEAAAEQISKSQKMQQDMDQSPVQNVPTSNEQILEYLKEMHANFKSVDSKLDSHTVLLEKVVATQADLTRRVCTLEEKSTAQAKEVIILKKENEYLRKKVKENNVMIYGITDDPQETPAELRTTVNKYIKDSLGLPEPFIDTISRMSTAKAGSKRPIQLRMVLLNEKDRIIKANIKHNIRMKPNRNSRVTITDDLTKEERQIGSIISKVVGLAKQDGKPAQHKGDYALIDGKKISFSEAKEILDRSAANQNNPGSQQSPVRTGSQ